MELGEGRAGDSLREPHPLQDVRTPGSLGKRALRGVWGPAGSALGLSSMGGTSVQPRVTHTAAYRPPQAEW